MNWIKVSRKIFLEMKVGFGKKHCFNLIVNKGEVDQNKV